VICSISSFYKLVIYLGWRYRPAMTGAVSRLERDGLARWAADPADGRVRDIAKERQDLVNDRIHDRGRLDPSSLH
jgi:hypothetical protein